MPADTLGGAAAQLGAPPPSVMGEGGRRGNGGAGGGGLARGRAAPHLPSTIAREGNTIDFITTLESLPVYLARAKAWLGLLSSRPQPTLWWPGLGKEPGCPGWVIGWVGRAGRAYQNADFGNKITYDIPFTCFFLLVKFHLWKCIFEDVFYI